MIDVHWSKPVLVVAEMHTLNFHASSGHCYPELIEKLNGRIIAQMRGVIWKDKFKLIRTQFLDQLGEIPQGGMKLLMEVKLKYSSVYGLSLEILSIDPTYTLGDLEKEKQETLSKLQGLGIISRNKEATLVLLPKKIAVISFESSKGYADFTSTIDEKGKRFGIHYVLFPAAMQGDQASAQIRLQLKQILKRKNQFDCVVIVRGGGDEAGMSCYNEFELCKAICEFPIPVFSGIGHSTNQTITELVSHTSAITPTALAERIVSRFLEQESALLNLEGHVGRTANLLLFAAANALLEQTRLLLAYSRNALDERKQELTDLPHRILRAMHSAKRINEHLLQQSSLSLSRGIERKLFTSLNECETLVERTTKSALYAVERESQKLEMLCMQNETNNPSVLLKKGYSLTFHGGKVLKDLNDLKAGDMLETMVNGGKIESTITHIEADL